MRHQFIGGPLNGKIILAENMGGSTKTSVPWEQYIKVATSHSSDGVLDVVQWSHRGEAAEVSATPTVFINALEDSSLGELFEQEIVLVHPPQAPVDGGFPAVTATLDKYVTTPILLDEAARNERLAKLQAVVAAERAARHPVGSFEHVQVTVHSQSYAPAVEPKLQPIVVEAEAAPEPTPVAPVVESNIETGDYGAVPGENLYETFEDRRKALKMSRDKFGIDMGLTKSFGWRLESGNVSAGDVKKLGYSNADEIYLAADVYLRNLEGR